MKKRSTFRSLLIFLPLIFLFFLTFNAPLHAQEEKKDVPYVPTSKPVVDKMLDLADVGKGDYVIDLGSGDGRIVIQAARRGADGHGVDIDSSMVHEARGNAKRAGVEENVMFLEKNLFNADISRANVITLYLLPSVNLKLRPRLLEQLEPGSKVVSHRFDMGTWEPDRKVIVKTGDRTPVFKFDRTNNFRLDNKKHEVYYWVIPADAEGRWKWETDGNSFTMNVKQKFQEVTVDIQREGQSMMVTEAALKGRRFRVNASNRKVDYLFNGRIQGDSIKGMVQIRSDKGSDKLLKWEASQE